MTRATRMLWGTCWVLALLLTSACDDLPAAPAGVAGARDLEFVLPAVKGTPGLVSQRHWVRDGDADTASRIAFAVGEPEAPDTPDDGGGAPAPEDGSRALIFSKYLTSSFEGDTYRFEYGLFGIGTSYAMTPNVHVARNDGTLLFAGPGAGRSESIYQVPLFMRPSAEESVRIGAFCGATGNVTVDFEVRIDSDRWGEWHSKANQGDRSSASQNGCAPSPPQSGGGGGPPGSDAGVLICYYELWIDQYGNVLGIVELGCEFIPYVI